MDYLTLPQRVFGFDQAQSKKIDYIQERQNWEDMIKQCFARFEGQIRVNMGDELSSYRDLWPLVPVGDWSV